MANSYEKSIKEFMDVLFLNLGIDRPDVQVEGQNKDINKFIAWYGGHTEWHVKKVIRDNKKVNVRIKESGFAKVVCEAWASNYANENTEINISKEKDHEIISKILEKNDFFGKWNKFVEKFMALGIAAMVQMPKNFTINEETHEVVTTKDNSIKIYFINGKRVYPITVDDGEVTECAFVRVTTQKIYLQIHVLDNDGNYIISEAEAPNKDGNAKFDYSTAKIWYTKSTEPLFQVWHPNIVDNKDIDNELGTSCYANSIDWLKTFDIIFDGMFVEFKNGRKKRFISADLDYIDENGNRTTTPLEEDDILLPKGLEGLPQINEFNGALRIEAYEKALTVVANMIGKQAGLGDARFKFDSSSGRPIQTATGIIASEKDAYTNIIKAENFATMNFKKMAAAIKYIYNECVSNSLTFDPDMDVTVVYDDNIIEDTDSKKKQEMSEVNAGVMSMAEYRSHWYGESLEEAKQFVQENGLLLDKYTLALTSKVITPEIFVNLVFGEDYSNKQELIDYITANLTTPTIQTGFEDESDEQDIEDEE